MQLRPGHKIVHYAEGVICAIGTVTAMPEESPRPATLPEQAWETDGFLCKVEYADVVPPIPFSDLPTVPRESGPFDVNGDVAQKYLERVPPGYLFTLLQFLNQRTSGLFDVPPNQHAEAASMTDDLDQAKRVVTTLSEFRNVVLEGVPGTGKTWMVTAVAAAWTSVTGRPLHYFGDDKPYATMVMHPSTSYEDFIEGIRPAVSVHASTPLFDIAPASPDGFAIRDGFFLRVCRIAVQHPDEDFLVLLDEVNRCNVSSVMGDLLLTLESSKRAKFSQRETDSPSAADWDFSFASHLPYSGRLLFVPDNVYVIATTNTTDRSIAPLDAALRRRFAFIRLEPEMATGISHGIADSAVADALRKSADLLASLNNDALIPCLGADSALGHSYLWEARSQALSSPDRGLESIRSLWRYAILPQLIDGLRAAGGDDLASTASRDGWFDERPELEDQRLAAMAAFGSLDDFVRDELGVQLAVDGHGLSRTVIMKPTY